MRNLPQQLNHRKIVTALLAATFALASCGGDDTSTAVVETDDVVESAVAEPAVTESTATEPADEGGEASGPVEYAQVKQSFGASGELIIAVGDGEAVTHAGTCDMWTSDVDAYVDFIGDEADLNLHQLITDDPNVGWSGPSAYGFVVDQDIAYELLPADLSFPAVNGASGVGTATTQAGETVGMTWSLTCG